MAIPTWITAQVLTASDVNTWFVPMIASKTSDTSRNTTTTVADDPHLTIAVASNALYVWNLDCEYNAAQAGDLKMVLTGPAGSSITSVLFCLDSAATSNQNVAITTRNSSLPSTAVTIGGNGATDVGFMWHGQLTTTATAGNFTLQWAQGTSSGTNTILYTGSFLKLDRCG